MAFNYQNLVPQQPVIPPIDPTLIGGGIAPMGSAAASTPNAKQSKQLYIQSIAQALANDPRNQYAQKMMDAGSSTAPSHNMWEGLARALQGVAGGWLQHGAVKDARQQQADLTAQGAQAAQEAMDAANQGRAALEAPSPDAPPITPPDAPPPAAGNDPQGAPPPPSGLPMPPTTGAPSGPVSGAPSGPPPSSNMQDIAAALANVQDPSSPPPSAMPGGPSASIAQSLMSPIHTGGRITGHFGEDRGDHVHNGVDIAAPGGTPIFPVAPGVVMPYTTQKDGGNEVFVKHPDGSVSGYAHLASYGAKPGTQVDTNTPIGFVGQTGNATGNSVHYTIKAPNGQHVDPTSYKIASAMAGDTGGPQSTGGGTVIPGVGAPPAWNSVQPVNNPLPISAPVPRPNAPSAVPITNVPMTMYRMAQRLIANPATYDRGMAMLDKAQEMEGTAEETYAGRRQGVQDRGYEGDINNWQNATNAIRQVQNADHTAFTGASYADQTQRNMAGQDNWRSELNAGTSKYQTDKSSSTQLATAGMYTQAQRDIAAGQQATERRGQNLSALPTQLQLHSMGLKMDPNSGTVAVDPTNPNYNPAISQIGAGIKPLPQKEADEIKSSSQAYRDLNNLISSFKPNYAMPGLDSMSDARLALMEKTGTNRDAVQWWKNFQAFKNGVARGNFGSRQTATELSRLQSQLFTPGSNPQVIQNTLNNYRNRLGVALTNDAKGSGTVYNPAEIYGMMGPDVGGALFPRSQPQQRGPAPAGNPAPQGGGQYSTGFATYRDGKWYVGQ